MRFESGQLGGIEGPGEVGMMPGDVVQSVAAFPVVLVARGKKKFADYLLYAGGKARTEETNWDNSREDKRDDRRP